MERDKILTLAGEALALRAKASKGEYFAHGRMSCQAVSTRYTDGGVRTTATIAELGSDNEPNAENAALLAFAGNHLALLADAVVELASDEKYFDGHGPLTKSGKHIPERCWKCCDSFRASVAAEREKARIKAEAERR